MILDEAIKHAEEVAVEQDKLCKRYDDASGYSRSHNEAIRTTEAKGCEKCASEHRQLAEWLKDYKRLKEQERCDDAVSRRAVIQHICEEKFCYKPNCKGVLFNRCMDITWVNELPPTRPNQWIPLKTIPMTDEESTFFRDWAEYGAELFDCPLPDDGQEVLVSWGGNVCIDTFVRDDRDGCYFEGVDIGDVEAWQPLPKPYESKEGSGEE